MNTLSNVFSTWFTVLQNNIALLYFIASFTYCIMSLYFHCLLRGGRKRL